jgi:hypothetical protein
MNTEWNVEGGMVRTSSVLLDICLKNEHKLIEKEMAAAVVAVRKALDDVRAGKWIVEKKGRGNKKEVGTAVDTLLGLLQALRKKVSML